MNQIDDDLMMAYATYIGLSGEAKKSQKQKSNKKPQFWVSKRMTFFILHIFVE